MRDTRLRPDSPPLPQGRGHESPSPATAEEAWGGGISPAFRSVPITRSIDRQLETTTDNVAEETPIALVYNGVPQVVMMATPADIEDLAVGFSVTEQIVPSIAEIQSVRVSTVQDGAQADISISGERLASLLKRQRHLTGRTGCGVCGAESIDQVVRTPPRSAADIRVSAAELHAALQRLNEQQPLNRVVGSVHGAAWVSGNEMVVREDVGRHNALDKVIGALLLAKFDLASGYLVITSRASYEMVLKAATVGVSVLIAVSAPTGLAIDLANRCNMTLVGFARDHSHVIYTHPQRITA